MIGPNVHIPAVKENEKFFLKNDTREAKFLIDAEQIEKVVNQQFYQTAQNPYRPVRRREQRQSCFINRQISRVRRRYTT